ncbi:hypothetical protein WT83_11635 [Burkholderia territorii]|uniref:FAD-binding FR-type domain-containing protein n=1 Tax=Burkholderia territorii TaxID=1503055 RepID=A0A124T8K2_9BURK|nr:hypothetical protein [Burkholderia territorii]KVL44153.1 hypothetical protein WT00_04150 [Burkholderia territorii]KWN18115.1 hypothetical protein WT83_11635 [Burkholderia territorii]
MHARYEFIVRAWEALGPHIRRARLQPVGAAWPAFAAGQYLKVRGEDGRAACFSIASAPGSDTIELHIEAQAGSMTAPLLAQRHRDGLPIAVEMPFGACTLSGTRGPVLFVAGHSGFAQAKSLLDQLCIDAHASSAALLWSADADYEHANADALRRYTERLDFRYRSIRPDAPPEARSAALSEVLRQFQRDTPTGTVVVSGSRELTQAVLRHGLTVKSDMLPG